MTQYLDAIAEKLGITDLPDRLVTTYLEAFAKHEGVDVSALPDRLVTTYLGAILKAKGVQSLPDNLLTTHLEALAGTYGATNLPNRLVSTYLEAIINNLDGGNLWNPAKNPIVQGSISSQTGGESDSTTRLRCEGYIKVEPNTVYTYESNVPRVFVIEYSEINTKPIDSSGWVTMPKTLTTSENTNYIRFTLAATGNGVVNADDFEWMRITKADTSSGTYSVMRMMTEPDGEEADYFEE